MQIHLNADLERMNWIIEQIADMGNHDKQLILIIWNIQKQMACRGISKTSSNIWDGAIARVVNYFYKSFILDLWLGSEYASGMEYSKLEESLTSTIFTNTITYS